MTIVDLIEEYEKMVQICNRINYSDKKSVKNNNKAVKRMYQIVNIIKEEFGKNGIYEFGKLLDNNDERTKIWASVQMLEKMDVDSITEQKALIIIKKEALQSVGMEYWLKSYQEKKKNRI
jgi:hypothetical protein